MAIIDAIKYNGTPGSIPFRNKIARSPFDQTTPPFNHTPKRQRSGF
ncbi:MAG: hypothetical protein LBM00_04275 [Deltaproteobacteria bacterium]|nr:hypothetical protein [Deltaproteobacteria bacterium]